MKVLIINRRNGMGLRCTRGGVDHKSCSGWGMSSGVGKTPGYMSNTEVRTKDSLCSWWLDIYLLLQEFLLASRLDISYTQTFELLWFFLFSLQFEFCFQSFCLWCKMTKYRMKPNQDRVSCLILMYAFCIFNLGWENRNKTFEGTL